MCHRVTPLSGDDLARALEERERTGRARLVATEQVSDAYPGSQVPLFVPGGDGRLSVATLTWGFVGPRGQGSRLVFNTRLDTAERHVREGRGMWAHALARGRCLLPVRRFFESWTINPPERGASVRFELAGATIFLLAAVMERDRFSVVTTAPNRVVAAHHSRMPLVLAPGESSRWLSGDYLGLEDRSGVPLVATPELKGEMQPTLDL